jgi:hypothetical protein
MLEFIAGIAVGAAFSPFWLKMWAAVSPRITALFNKQPPKN